MKIPNPTFPTIDAALDAVFNPEDRLVFEMWLKRQVEAGIRKGLTEKEIHSYVGDILVKLFRFAGYE
jgi:hypothetical protein